MLVEKQNLNYFLIFFCLFLVQLLIQISKSKFECKTKFYLKICFLKSDKIRYYEKNLIILFHCISYIKNTTNIAANFFPYYETL